MSSASTFVIQCHYLKQFWCNYLKISILEFYLFICFIVQYGLYSAFMGCFIYCFLGTSKDITLGPTAIMSLMTATFCAYTNYPSHLKEHEIQELQAYFNPIQAVVLSLFSGVVQFLMGALHIGSYEMFFFFLVKNDQIFVLYTGGIWWVNLLNYFLGWTSGKG